MLFLSAILVTSPGSETVIADEDFWVTLEPMQQVRSDLGVVAVNDKIYAIRGNTERGYIPTFVWNDYARASAFLSGNFKLSLFYV